MPVPRRGAEAEVAERCSSLGSRRRRTNHRDLARSYRALRRQEMRRWVQPIRHEQRAPSLFPPWRPKKNVGSRTGRALTSAQRGLPFA